MSQKENKKVEHPFVHILVKDFDIDATVEKALRIIIKRDYPEIAPQITIFAAKHKTKKFRLAFIKYMHHDWASGLFTSFSVALTTDEFYKMYSKDENEDAFWYDQVTVKTIDQYLKIIPEEHDELFTTFARYLMNFGKHNKYKYGSIIFHIIAEQSFTTAVQYSAAQSILKKYGLDNEDEHNKNNSNLE